jgi:hypothetical protein
MTDTSNQIVPKKIPWNKSRTTGPKAPLKPKQVWSIRTRLQVAKRTRDLALFDLAIDSKLRGCDLVRLKIADVALHGVMQTRATVTQRKTGRPVQFEITHWSARAIRWSEHSLPLQAPESAPRRRLGRQDKRPRRHHHI